MKIGHCLPILISLSTSCVTKFTMTASIDNVRWYGSGLVSQINPEKIASCPEKRFSISAISDVPYETATAAKPTGCIKNSIPTQFIDIFNIPLAKGKYDLTYSDQCLPRDEGKVRLGHLILDPKGSHIIKGESVTVADDFWPAKANNWLRVTSFNPGTGLVKGKFQVTLVNKKGQTRQLDNGKFRGKI
jgi:hypothetical protein